MAIIKIKIHAGQQPTEEQIKEIELASAQPAMPDDDAPELTLEQYAEMAVLAKGQKKPNK